MPISIECQGCGFRASVPDAFAGRAGKCKRCGARVAVPGPGAALRVDPAPPGPEPAIAAAIPELDTSTIDFPTVEVDEEGADVDSLLDEPGWSPPPPPPRPASGPARPSPRAIGAEPWYYRFLVVYAYLIIGIGTTLGIALIAFVAAAASNATEAHPFEGAIMGLAPAFGLILGSFAVGAPILLGVDAARSLRSIRSGQ